MLRTAGAVAITCVLAVVTSGCVESGSPPAASTVTTSADDVTTTSTTMGSTTTDATGFDGDGCGEPEIPFTEEGLVGSGGIEESDAAVIESFTWTEVGACERFRVGFATLEGAPAVSPPLVGVQFLRHAGIIRVVFDTSVTDTVIGEQVVDTETIDRVYTVSRVDEAIYIDIHLRQPVFARVRAETTPAAVIIDLMPGGDPYPDPPVRADDIVIIQPEPDAIGYPITITGYTLDPSDRIEGVLRSPDGSNVLGRAAVGNHDHTWGGFSMVFPDGPPGEVTITVDDGPQMVLTLP